MYLGVVLSTPLGYISHLVAYVFYCVWPADDLPNLRDVLEIVEE